MAATGESETWKSRERAESKVADERIQKRMLEVTRARRGAMRATTWKERKGGSQAFPSIGRLDLSLDISSILKAEKTIGATIRRCHILVTPDPSISSSSWPAVFAVDPQHHVEVRAHRWGKEVTPELQNNAVYAKSKSKKTLIFEASKV
jgi:membrane glycosyltransferase